MLHLKKENFTPIHLTTRSISAILHHVITIQRIKANKGVVNIIINNQVLSYLL